MNLKNQLLTLLIVALSTTIGWSQIQQDTTNTELDSNCIKQLSQPLDFLTDGSFNDNTVLQQQLNLLSQACTLDSYDVDFFANMDVFSVIISRITKQKTVDQITFEDWYNEIHSFKQNQIYKEIRTLTIASQQLGNTIAHLDNWSHDITIFNQLGASQRVINQVEKYLKSHPNNTKTYQQILEQLKD